MENSERGNSAFVYTRSGTGSVLTHSSNPAPLKMGEQSVWCCPGLTDPPNPSGPGARGRRPGRGGGGSGVPFDLSNTEVLMPFSAGFRFFVVEDHILHTTQGLVNRAYIDELWEMALSKTIAALRTHSVSKSLGELSCCLTILDMPFFFFFPPQDSLFSPLFR